MTLLCFTPRSTQCYDHTLEPLFPFILPTFHPFSPPSHCYCTMDTLPSLLVIALSWTYLLIPRLGQDALRTVHALPYLLHALPPPLRCYLRAHQYLLMRTLRAPPMPVHPHCCLMYHHTISARFTTPLHVYYHAPCTRYRSISTGLSLLYLADSTS